MIYFSNPWLLFCIAFAVMLTATAIMGRLAEHFYTMDPIKRKFSMLEMEFPDKYSDLEYLVSGIDNLPDKKERAATLKAVRGQLWFDNLMFIPATYGGIFVLCMAVGNKLHHYIGKDFFYCLAYLQCLCLVLDYTENTFFFWLLMHHKGEEQIRPAKPGAIASRRAMMAPGSKPPEKEATDMRLVRLRILEAFKWGPSLLGAICGFSALAYFWLSGEYSLSSLEYILIPVVALLVMILVNALQPKPAVYSTAGQMPVPNYDIETYLSREISKIPAVQSGDMTGCVTVKFVVDENGEISTNPAPQVTRSPGGACDAEAIRIIAAMPKWQPGMQKGKPVKVYIELTLCFKQ